MANDHHPSGLWPRLIGLVFVITTSLLSLAIILFGDRLLNLSPFFKNPVISLYIRQFLRAVSALPLFFLWLEFSKTTGMIRVLKNIKEWWFNKPLPVFLSLAFFASVTLIVALFAYHKIPKGDAVWPYFQTKIFAQGKLFAPAPFDFRFFFTPTIVHNGKWFSYTSPGHSILLLPFYLLGITYLTGPVLGTIALFLLYLFAEKYTDPRIARLSLLLAATSPFMLLLFGSQEFHISSTFFTLLALFSLLKATKRTTDEKNSFTRKIWALVSGLSLGMVFLTRPWTAIGIGIPLIIIALFKIRNSLLPFLLGGLLMVLLHLLYNRALTGSFLTFPYQLFGRYHQLGFGAGIGAPTFNLPGHSPLKLVINLLYNLFVLNLHLFGWAFLSLTFLILGLGTRGYYRHLLLWLPAAGLFIAYSLYWFHGITPWGPKYYSEALPFFIITGAIGISQTGKGRTNPWLGNDFTLRAIPFLILYSLLIYIPTTFTYLSSGRWGETPKIAYSVQRAKIHNAVVFIHTDETTGSFDYTSAFIFNDPFLKGDVIFPRDLGTGENQRFLRMFPDRSAYIYDFKTETLIPLDSFKTSAKY
jgi:hypothetical protein